MTLAASLFPDRRNENPFFVEGPRKIFAHLLTYRPTPEEIAWWMCHDEEIDQRVKGTQYAAMIGWQALAQRSGVLASLNMVADSLKLLPSEKKRRDGGARWNSRKSARVGCFLQARPKHVSGSNAHQSVAGHAGAAIDEPRTTKLTQGLVRLG